MDIYFAGLAKNCKNNLSKNLNFILNLTNKYSHKHNIYVYIFENDSVDGTKNLLNSFVDWRELSVFTEDGLTTRIENRIKRISYCREFLLNKILSKKDKMFIYIPLDLDLDLFGDEGVENFYEKINKVIKDESVDAIFPFSVPRYYDIHALRAKNWNERDGWELVKKYSKYILVGKFFLKYMLIYRKQKKLSSFNEKSIKVDSAFGGIGIYKTNKNNIDSLSYSNDFYNDECEHVFFNKNFSNKYIDKDWKIISPSEHIEYHNNRLPKKILYILNSLIRDIKNLFTFLVKN
tara:strand:- start:521 stop:1393 length:873 start_codon:yes stop_codon:yes gene_type:complete